ncbi:hypothetical protein LTR48_002219 [Friedmanniomyces endolithicus]|uniref:HTH APSES-type domain-containing protein n=1 Tax=Rachicladosporium monterosium TaxID=1507873 RepID=A0ABR0LBK6_9PEZI|nr:hypothetical protein LTR29_001346 [Friedmanniomyces endolithicus]KAK1093488.1 hypothetical protein LTR48_002219 [Friedmanniomyces endolithicus]KAK5146440.1 hypothetical protein LTR32_001974 [Rachicladosporium monterosium]
MAEERALPERRNPMLDDDHAPQYEILVERRCLGQTELKVKPGQVGTSNATKPDNLGVLEYAHLRVPLPKDLSGSGIFSKGPNRKWPEAYFLMRRSSDGYVSATGMFKAAFPYAQTEDEQLEKDYLKETHNTSSEEVAGNVWIHPEQAIDLAEEYGIGLWISALLDPEPITHGTSPGKAIKSPPTYRIKDMANGAVRSPEKKSTVGRQSVRGRRSASVRSDEPEVEAKTPSRPKATPRKPRKGRSALSQVAEDDASEPLNGAAKLEEVQETVKVTVETTTHLTASGDEEIERTKVNVEMPTGNPDLPLPTNPQEMLAEARKMVAEAQKVGGPSKGKGKRKVEEMLDDDDDELDVGPALPPKRARKLEIELRKERIARRALTGIAASLLLGALVPTIAAAFGA